MRNTFINKSEKVTKTMMKNLKKFPEPVKQALFATVIAIAAVATTAVAMSSIMAEKPIYNIQMEEVSIQQMIKDSFNPDKDYKQYIVDSNSVNKTITMKDSNYTIQESSESFSLNILIKNGSKYIDTFSKSNLESAINDLMKSYKNNIPNNKINNENRINKIEKNIKILEQDKDNIENQLTKLSDKYYKIEDNIDKRVDKLYILAGKYDTKENTSKYTGSVDEILDIKKEIFNLREQYNNKTTPSTRAEKKVLQNELNSIRHVMYKEYRNIPRAISYEFNDFDKDVKLLEKQNHKIERKELQLIDTIDEIRNSYFKKKDLANLPEILDYHKDLDFIAAIKNHIKASETSKPGGNYAEAKDIKDGAGISYGAYQFTENSGKLIKFLKIAGEENDEAKSFSKQFKNHGSTFIGLKYGKNGLLTFLKEFGNTEKGQQLQDEFYNDEFLKPAFNLIDKHEITDKFAIAQITDHYLNAGSKGAIQLIARIERAGGDFSEKSIIMHRENHYLAIVAGKNRKEAGQGDKFKKGWLNRVDNTTKAFEEYSDSNILLSLNQQEKTNKINKNGEIHGSIDSFKNYYKNLKKSTINEIEIDREFT